MNSKTEIPTLDEWKWYKSTLDTNRKYHHRHEGEPASFPCLVRSEWGDDPNGPYYYAHYFTYKKEVTCEHCGHKTQEWDHENEA